MNDINKQLIDFISASPSAYHTVENVRRELDAAGYTELFEGDDWSVTVLRPPQRFLHYRAAPAEAGFPRLHGHGRAQRFAVVQDQVEL